MGNAESQKRHHSESSGKAALKTSLQRERVKSEKNQSHSRNRQRSVEDSVFLQQSDAEETPKISNNRKRQYKNDSAHESTSSTIGITEQPADTSYSMTEVNSKKESSQSTVVNNSTCIELCTMTEVTNSCHSIASEIVSEKVESMFPSVVSEACSDGCAEVAPELSECLPNTFVETDTNKSAHVIAHNECNGEYKIASSNKSDHCADVIINSVVENLLDDLLQVVTSDSDSSPSEVCSKLLREFPESTIPNASTSELLIEHIDANTSGIEMENTDEDVKAKPSDHDFSTIEVYADDNRRCSLTDEVAFVVEQMIENAVKERDSFVLHKASFSESHQHFDVESGVRLSNDLKTEENTFEANTDRETAEAPTTCQSILNESDVSFEENRSMFGEIAATAIEITKISGDEKSLQLKTVTGDTTTNVILSSLNFIESEDTLNTVKLVLESILNTVESDVILPGIQSECLSSNTNANKSFDLQDGQNIPGTTEDVSKQFDSDASAFVSSKEGNCEMSTSEKSEAYVTVAVTTESHTQASAKASEELEPTFDLKVVTDENSTREISYEPPLEPGNELVQDPFALAESNSLASTQNNHAETTLQEIVPGTLISDKENTDRQLSCDHATMEINEVHSVADNKEYETCSERKTSKGDNDLDVFNSTVSVTAYDEVSPDETCAGSFQTSIDISCSEHHDAEPSDINNESEEEIPEKCSELSTSVEENYEKVQETGDEECIEEDDASSSSLEFQDARDEFSDKVINNVIAEDGSAKNAEQMDNNMSDAVVASKVVGMSYLENSDNSFTVASDVSLVAEETTSVPHVAQRNGDVIENAVTTQIVAIDENSGSVYEDNSVSEIKETASEIVVSSNTTEMLSNSKTGTFLETPEIEDSAPSIVITAAITDDENISESPQALPFEEENQARHTNDTPSSSADEDASTGFQDNSQTDMMEESTEDEPTIYPEAGRVAEEGYRESSQLDTMKESAADNTVLNSQMDAVAQEDSVENSQIDVTKESTEKEPTSYPETDAVSEEGDSENSHSEKVDDISSSEASTNAEETTYSKGVQDDVDVEQKSEALPSKESDAELSENFEDDDFDGEQNRESRLSARGVRLLKRKQEEAASGMKLKSVSPQASSISNTNVYNHSTSSSLSGVEGLSNIDLESSNAVQELKSALTQLEEKYRQAMVQAAQLDNERSQLYYQTQQLKDLLEEQEDGYYRLKSEHAASCHEVERQKRTIGSLQRKCNDLQDALTQRDELIQEEKQRNESRLASQVFDLREIVRLKVVDGKEQGLVVVGGHGEDQIDGRGPHDAEYSSKIALVTPEAAEVLQSAGDGPLDSRLKNLAEEKQKLLNQIRRLQNDLEDERSRVVVNGSNDSLNQDNRLPDMQLLEAQREANKVVNEYKLKLQKSEQDVIACHGNIARLETQLQRLKQTVDNFEKNEDDMRAEKRKLMRDLRTALDRIEEVEMTNSHLEKRLERMRASRTSVNQT